MKCVKCGSELFPEDVFCWNCGASTTNGSSDSKKTCKKCGKELLDNDEFCWNCGTSIHEDKKEEPPKKESLISFKKEEKKEEKIEEKKVEEKKEEKQKGSLISMGSNKEEPTLEEKKPVSMNRGDGCKLTLRREKSIVGFAVGYNVFIDDNKVGKIKNGQTLDLIVTRGKHTIAISNKKNKIDIVINGDTSADVTLVSPNEVGISNVKGSGDYSALNRDNNVHYEEKAKKSANTCLCFTGALPLISLLWLWLVGGVVSPIVYGLFIGYCIINLAGLKKLNNPSLRTSLLIKNIIAMVLFIVECFITILIVI